MSVNNRWVLPQVEQRTVDSLAAALAIQPLTARILASRGLADPEAAARFLAPSLEHLHDPMRLSGIAEAVHRLRAAIAAQEKILIYGDYDVDGTISVVMLLKAIQIAGGQAAYYVPHRIKDGYGMRSEVIERAAADGIQLIISVDTG